MSASLGPRPVKLRPIEFHDFNGIHYRDPVREAARIRQQRRVAERQQERHSFAVENDAQYLVGEFNPETGKHDLLAWHRYNDPVI